MTCDEAFAEWGESPPEALRAAWQDSMACLPKGTPDFLDPACLRDALAFAGVDRAEVDPVLRTAAQVNRDGALKRLAWHCVQLLYGAATPPANGTRDWPRLETALGRDSARYFYFLVTLASVDYVRAFHRRHGVPEDVTRATCSDVRRFRPCLVGHTWALPDTLIWLRHAAVGDLFRLGRHQYIRGPFRGGVFVFRRRASGEVAAIAAAGQRFTADGYCDGDGGVRDPGAWEAPFEMDERQVRGVPVAPTGHAVAHEVRLPLDEWSLLMVPETPVLQMHIPRDGPMPPAETGASLRRAARFFPRFFPGRSFRACACGSWLFYPRWQEVLGPDSNIAGWQREQYLFPAPAMEPGALPFIFGFGPFDPATAPRDTRLRRAAAAWLEAGEPLRSGGMFVLPEDLPRFGSEPYLRDWARVRRRLGIPA